MDIYNFFPVDESEKEIGLKLNITRKIQAFHDTLGEDAKYLTENEEVSSHNLFGQKFGDFIEKKGALWFTISFNFLVKTNSNT